MESTSKKLARSVLRNDTIAATGVRKALQHVILEYVLPFEPTEEQADLIEGVVEQCAPTMITLAVCISDQKRVGIFLHDQLELDAHKVFDLALRIQRAIDKFTANVCT